jgi:hypothetical protein
MWFSFAAETNGGVGEMRNLRHLRYFKSIQYLLFVYYYFKFCFM